MDFLSYFSHDLETAYHYYGIGLGVAVVGLLLRGFGPFRAHVVALFGAFIVACGIGHHAMDVGDPELVHLTGLVRVWVDRVFMLAVLVDAPFIVRWFKRAKSLEARLRVYEGLVQ